MAHALILYISILSFVALHAMAKWIEPADTLRQYPPQKKEFQQRVDHSSFNIRTSRMFAQRYWVYDKFWRKPTTSTTPGPILFFFSGEGPVDDFYRDTTVLFSSLGPQLQGSNNACVPRSIFVTSRAHKRHPHSHGKRLMPYSYAILQAPAAYRPWDDAYLIRRINREEDDDYHFNTIIAF